MNGTHFCWKAPELVLISLSLDETKYAQMHFQTRKKIYATKFYGRSTWNQPEWTKYVFDLIKHKQIQVRDVNVNVTKTKTEPRKISKFRQIE